MQCTSYVPVYYHARDLNAGENVFSRHPFDGNNSSGEERGYSIAMLPSNMDQYLAYDKEVVKQMIQNHEAMFRNQVQELHRVYRRQRELMVEMRMREMFAQPLLSQTSESVHSSSHAWPEFSRTPSHATSWVVGDCSRNFQRPSEFVAENSYTDVKVQSKGSENRVLDLELPTDTYHDDQGSNINGQKTNCFIDLNEPIELESLPSSSSEPCETRTSHMEIDLNSMPVSCSSETEKKNEECVVHHPFTENKINDKFLKTEIVIDLNLSIEDEHPPHLSSTVLPIKTEEDTELVGPVSPENEECSPPRGKSEDITLLSEQGEGEPSVELDTTTAAQTLVTISSSRVQEYDPENSLCWFAGIVSSTGDDLENKIMELKRCHVKKERETGILSGKGRTRGRKQCKDFQIEGPFKRKTGKKACAKPRKYSKLSSSSDEIRKPMSLILKQPAACSKQGVLQSWGHTRKRQGGRRRRATRFLVSL